MTPETMEDHPGRNRRKEGVKRRTCRNCGRDDVELDRFAIRCSGCTRAMLTTTGDDGGRAA